MRKVNGRTVSDPFRGRIMFVWNAAQFDATRVCLALKHNGWSGLAIKTHDGFNGYCNSSTNFTWRDACRRIGLDFGHWGYCRETGSAGAEGRFAAKLAHDWDADFYIADAEIEYEQAQNPVSREFASGFREEYRHLRACLSSFGRIDYHAGIDFRAWSDNHFGFMPQCYTVDNASALWPARCISIASSVFAMRAIYPTISTMSDSNGYPFSSSELASQLKGLPTKGLSCWEWSICRTSDVVALGRAGK